MIRKRHVFYLSGFDPRGPSFYHGLYQTESQSQAHMESMSISVGKRTSPSKRVSRWEITARTQGLEVSTRYDFLRWDDIIRRHWTRNEGRLLAQTLSTFWLFLRTGRIATCWTAAWKPTALFIFPTAFLVLTLVLAVAGGWAAYQQFSEGHFSWLPAVGAGVVFLATLAVGRLMSSRISAYWLLRLCNFCGAYGQGRLDCMDERLAEFANLMADEIRKEEADEYLIVGHSVGGILVIPVLAKLLNIMPGLAGKNIALLTLGQCIPLVSFLPHAKAFRNDLKAVADAKEVFWADFTSPADPASFALVDPVGAAGISVAASDKPRPRLLNTRFYKTVAENRYRKMRWDGKRLHFQYLMAGDFPGDYDFFAITAGGVSLAERFGTTPSIQPVYPG